jgi:hypothetical protein
MSAERARRADKIAAKFEKQGDMSSAGYWRQKAENYRKLVVAREVVESWSNA